MSSGKRKIPKRWFGYQVKETEAYLRKLESMQREESEEIEKKIKAQRAQLEELQAKLSEMRSKPNEPALSPEKAALLLERLDRSVEAIVSQGEAETESLRRLQERKLEQHDKRMSEWDKQSEDYRKALDFLLEEASDLIFKVKSKQKSDVPDQSQLEKEAGEAMRLSRTRSSVEDVWESKERDEEASGLNEKPEPLQASAKILQFKLRSILNEVTETEEETAATHSSMTADGMTMDESKKALPAKPNSNKKTDYGKSFWGDMEAYLEEDEPRQTLDFPSETADIAEAPQVVGEENLGLSSEQAEPESNELKPSPGLTEEILSIKNRYIVGKVAGENLYASDGGLIVAKGNTITSEIVQKAEREGKLPDLIVHMVIPGLGSDGS